MINLKETKRLRDAIARFPLSYENIIEDTDLGVAVIDEKGVLVAVNNSYCSILNYTRQELVGNHFSVLLPPDLKRISEINHTYFFKAKSSRLEKTEAVTKLQTRIKIFTDSFYISTPDKRSLKITFVSGYEEGS